MSKKDEELAKWLASEDSTVDTNALSQWLGSEETDPSIPLPISDEPVLDTPTVERDLSLRQKGVNLASQYMKQDPAGDLFRKIFSGTEFPSYGERDGRSAPYPEKVSAEQLKYENINPLYATYEAGKSILGDIGALGSASGGYALDQLGLATEKPFMERVQDSSFFQPNITEKGQDYRQKFDENIPAIGGLNQLSALSRLKPVVGMPSQFSISKLNPSDKIKKGMQVVGDEVSDITSAIGSKIPKTLIGNQSRVEYTKQYLLTSGIKPSQNQQQKMGTYGNNSAYDDAVEIIYKDNITLDAKGIKILRNNTTSAGKKMDDFIEQNKNISIKKSRVFNDPELQKLRKKFIESVDGEKDLKAFDAVIDNFRKNNPGTFTVKDAQKFKTNTYSILNKKAYNQEATLSAANEAKKYVARILKEEIERTTTRLGIDGKTINVAKDLNRETQKYINALDVITKREFVSGKSNPIHGLALLAHDPLLLVGQHLQASSPFKVNAAKLINRLQTNKSTPIKNEAGYITQMVNDAMKKMTPFDQARGAGLLQTNETLNQNKNDIYQGLLRKKQQ